MRADDSSALLPAAEALAQGGVRAIEFPYVGGSTLEVLRAVRSALPGEVVLGAGTILDGPAAAVCIEAGAQYVVSPIFKQEVQDVCNEAGVPTIPGGATPSEIERAWEAGASLVKVFPASVYGPRFIRDVSAPFPEIKLAAFAGIPVEEVADYLRAGAVAIGVASGLVGRDLGPSSIWDAITGNARAYVSAINNFDSD